jgi:predicted MFS family arabinose efflux permease
VAPTLSVLTRQRDFRYLFLAELVVFGGDWFVLIPLVTLLQDLTGSGLPGAIALAADTAVGALVLPLAGTFADRMNRRTLMIAANIGAIAAVALLFAVRSAQLAWIGPVAIGLAAVAKAVYTPAASAALPNVVDADDLPAANALAGSAWGTMAVVGASLGGVLSQVVSPYACFGITVVCLGAAALLVLRVRRPLQAPRTGPRPAAQPVRDIAEALRFIRVRPRVASLVTVKSAVGLGNGVLAAFPVLAVTYGLGAIATGLLFAARGVGVIVGPLLFRRVLDHRDWLMPGLAISMASYGVAYLAVAVTPWFWLVLVLVAVAHVAGGGNWVMSSYALQITVPDQLRGRVFSTDHMIVSLSISVSMLVAGALVDAIDPRAAIAVCGGLTACYGLVWYLVTRRLMRDEPVVETAAEVSGRTPS